MRDVIPYGGHRIIAREKPDAEILVLCYNVALASYLRAALADNAGVRVHHFDGGAKRNGVVRKRATETEPDEDDAEPDDQPRGRFLLDLLMVVFVAAVIGSTLVLLLK